MNCCDHPESQHIVVIGGGHACLGRGCSADLDAAMGYVGRMPPSEAKPCCEREHTESCGSCVHPLEHHIEGIPTSRSGEALRVKGFCKDCAVRSLVTHIPPGAARHRFESVDRLPEDIQTMKSQKSWSPIPDAPGDTYDAVDPKMRTFVHKKESRHSSITVYRPDRPTRTMIKFPVNRMEHIGVQVDDGRPDGYPLVGNKRQGLHVPTEASSKRYRQLAGKIKQDNNTRVAQGIAKGEGGGRIILVRHGATALNGVSDDDSAERIRGWSNPPLTAEGKTEAAARAKEIAAQFNVGKIFTSDLQRAAVTAKLIAKATKSPVEVTKELRPWDLGHLTGKNVQAVKEEMNGYIKTPEKIVPEGESLRSFEDRLFAGLKKIFAQAGGDQDIVIVTHTRDVRAILGWIEAGEGSQIDDDYLLEKKDPIKPGGLMVLSRTGKKWSVGMKKSQSLYKGYVPSEGSPYERCSASGCGHARGNHNMMGCMECDPRGTRTAMGDGNAAHAFTSVPKNEASAAAPESSYVSSNARRPTSRSQILFDLHDRFHGTARQRVGGELMPEATKIGKSQDRFDGPMRQGTHKWSGQSRIAAQKTNPAAVKQIKDARANKMGQLGKSESAKRRSSDRYPMFERRDSYKKNTPNVGSRRASSKLAKQGKPANKSAAQFRHGPKR